MISLGYLTNRKDCRAEWWFDSLHRECNGDYRGLQIIVADYWCGYRQGAPELFAWMERIRSGGGELDWGCIKPNPWNGAYRLTKDPWFAAASQRNGILCKAKHPFLAYCDDLSVLMPGWLSRVRKAMAEGYIVCGSYKKVKELQVESGEVKAFKEYPAGVDNRLKHAGDVVPCGGNWLYGCSLAGPVEAFLSVNGWPEDLCDGLGFEDCCMGLALKNAGHDLRYDPKMMTYESEELHFVEPAFRKEDWHFEDGKPIVGGNGGTDKSHAALHIAQGSAYFPNSFGEGGIRVLRQRVLAGESFPVKQIPDRDWYTKIPLSEL